MDGQISESDRSQNRTDLGAQLLYGNITVKIIVKVIDSFLIYLIMYVHDIVVK